MIIIIKDNKLYIKIDLKILYVKKYTFAVQNETSEGAMSRF